MSSSRRPSQWGIIRSLLVLSPVLFFAPFLALRHHTTLPEPSTSLTDPLTSLPQLSEPRILSIAKHLSEEIGFRTVGTREHAVADEWMLQQAEDIKKECERIVKQEGRKLECEVWRQEGSGSHRFDMMGKRLYKTYINLRNVVVRISDGTPESKAHAVLVNAHLDSTLPSPGAADDALSIGIMLDCMRVLIGTPGWSPSHAIVFLFNGAEESLQDGSHLFSTQHPIRDTIRAVVNLEAAGTTGRELLFQATSQEMVEHYSQVPRPFGTIFANEIFSSGVLLSDTDFRQFELYLNITGLDMAVVGNSYLYHMRKDLVENIPPGVAQHMAANVHDLLVRFTSPTSPLPSLTQGYTRPSTVFYTYLGYFYIYSYTTAKAIYGVLLAASILWIICRSSVNDESVSPKGKEAADRLSKEKAKRGGIVQQQLKGCLHVFAGFLGALLGANVVALIMSLVLGKGMSWFTQEYSALFLYAPPALCGALLSQFLLGPIPETTLLNSIILLQSFTAFALQMANIGSSAIFALSAGGLLVAMALNVFLEYYAGHITLWTYAIGQFNPLFTETLTISAIFDFFVPLTGRIGATAPADHIIATITSVLGSHALPLVLPFAHRFPRPILKRAVLLSAAVSVVMMGIFCMREPFDIMHQKRVFVIHSENVTSLERHLHIATADGAPGFKELVHDIGKEFGAPGAKPTLEVMDDYNSDWDSLYPFSAFLAPWKIELPEQSTIPSSFSNGDKFTVEAVNDVIDVKAGTRSLTLKVYHPGLIWTVIAFDAHVLKWTLDENPPDEHVRHHIKEASFYGQNTYTVDLTIKIPPSETVAPLKVNYVGIQEKGMWPAKIKDSAADIKGGHRLSMSLFDKLDRWIEEKTGGTVDALLLGCVGGVTIV